jgi:uncharacterized membrane protein YvbJ
MMDRKFCSSCGTPLNPGVSFCGNCGNSSDGAPASGEHSQSQNAGFSSQEDTKRRNLIIAVGLIVVVGIWYLFIRTPSNSEVCKHVTGIMGKTDEIPKCVADLAEMSMKLPKGQFKNLKKCAIKATTKEQVRECGKQYGN